MASAGTTPDEPSELAALAGWAARVLGSPVVGIEPVVAGLGLRRFHRLRLGGSPWRAILRIDASEDPAGRPAGAAPEPPLEPIRALLERGGLPVPHRLGGDPARGLELLEDGGPESLYDRWARSNAAERRALLTTAASFVPRLQRVRDDGSGVEAFRRRLDATLFRYKADLFVDRSLPLALRRRPTAAEAGAVREAFAWIAAHCAEAPLRLAHRDFQSHNLLVREDGEGRLAWMLIDLQGAFLAPPEYDLVCLLRDSYLAPNDALARDICAQLRPELPDAPAADAFALRFDLLTLTRKGKDHARFLAALERGETRYRRHLAPTAAMLRTAAARTRSLAPPLARLAELVEQLPGELEGSSGEAPCAR